MLFQQNTVKQTKNSLEHEAGEELVLEAKDFFDAEEDILAEIKIDTSEVNANKVGEYEAIATYKSKEYTIDVKVVDTTVPKVTFAQRYVFTNDAANPDLTGMFESIQDASECTAKLVRFERKENLSAMDEKTLKSFTDAINTHAKDEELKAIGTADVPSDDENVISPYMQMLIDAGYGNVVDWGDGEYGVLVHKGYQVNGKEAHDEGGSLPIL